MPLVYMIQKLLTTPDKNETYWREKMFVSSTGMNLIYLRK